MKNRFCNQFCKINIIIDCVIFVHFPCKIKIKAKWIGTRTVGKKATEHISKQLFPLFTLIILDGDYNPLMKYFIDFCWTAKNIYFMLWLITIKQFKDVFYYKSLVIALERYYFSKWKEEKPGDSCILILLCSSLLIFVSGRSRRKNIASCFNLSLMLITTYSSTFFRHLNISMEG